MLPESPNLLTPRCSKNITFGPADVAELVTLLDGGAAPTFAVGTASLSTDRFTPGAVVRPSRCVLVAAVRGGVADVFILFPAIWCAPLRVCCFWRWWVGGWWWRCVCPMSRLLRAWEGCSC